MLRNEASPPEISELEAKIGELADAEASEWQQLIAKYEREIADVPLETVRFAEEHMGIISSPDHFGEAMDDALLTKKMIEFEARRYNLDPDLPLVVQLGQANFDQLDASLSIVSTVKDVDKAEVTLRQAATAAVTNAADLAGIHERWVSVPPGEKTKPEVIAKSVAIGVKLLKEYVTQFSEEPEGIILTTSFLPKDMAALVIEQALHEGILSKKPKYFEVRLYCAGTAAALAIALANPDFAHMSNIAILTLEPISALIEDRHSGFDNYQSAVIFSDDYLIARIKPSEFQLSPESVIQGIDDGGVIELESWSAFPQEEELTTKQDWVKQLLREGEPGLIYVDDTHMIVNMRSPEADQPRARMKAIPTAKFFASRSPEIIFELLTKHKIYHVFNHEPSDGVLTLISRGLSKLIKKHPEKMKQTPESVPELVRMRKGNSSSGTFFRQLVELARNGQLSDSAFLKPTLVFAPGAGATFAAVVIERTHHPETEVTIFSAPDSD